jgi:uncharacterized protein (TIGR02246 family)
MVSLPTMTTALLRLLANEMRQSARLQIATALTTAALGACGPALVNQQTEEQSVRSRSNEWQSAIAAHDSERVLAILAPTAVVISAHSPLAAGPAALRELTQRLVSDRRLSLTWVPTRIEVASPTVAIEYGVYTLVYTSAQGNFNDAGNYTNIWHKIGGRWRVTLHAIVTSRPMP